MPEPRARADWLQQVTTALAVAFIMLAATGIANSLSNIQKDLRAFNVEIAGLKTTLALAMADRFSGQQGVALTDRVQRIEQQVSGMDLEINALKQWYAGHTVMKGDSK